MIRSDAVPPWVAILLRSAQVIAPRTLHELDVTYDEIETPEQIAWSYGTSISPLKRQLFPQTDPLFCWHRRPDDGHDLRSISDNTKRVFLGVRPCDVSAVLFLDKVFGREPADTHYLARRSHTTLVALACTEPSDQCFCVCANAGPFLDGGYDMQLTPLGGGYLAEVGSDRGQEMVRQAGDLFFPAPEESLDARFELERQAERKLGEEKAYFAAALRKVTFNRVADELWEQMSSYCLGCGACAFVCPTCTCFTTADFDGAGDGVRCRLWDSCLYESYAREASGHNPRAQREDRLKARFFHKLGYQFVQKFGSHGCVGCGRCVTACLGRNDMPEVTARIRQGVL
jgi:ferredoxin